MPKPIVYAAIIILFTVPLFSPFLVTAQQSFKGLEPLFTSPRQYNAVLTAAAPLIDGDINDKSWVNVPWTENFSDIEGDLKPAPYFKTRCKMIWDKNYLYIAAELKENQLWANVKNHDEVVFLDNDFEVFIDPDNNAYQYFEIELNAINTVWELFLSKPYRNDSGPLMSWDAPGLKTAVKVLGTVNDPSDTDKGWTVEMAIPYAALSIGNDVKIPEDGDLWRINFSRVEWDTHISGGKYVKSKDENGKNLPEHNWVWSPQGVIDMHYPERWGYLKFSKSNDQSAGKFLLPYAEKQKNSLWLTYYRQKEYQKKHGKYAGSLQEIGVSAVFDLDGKKNVLEMEATGHQFYVSIKADGHQTITINQEGMLKNELLIQ